MTEPDPTAPRTDPADPTSPETDPAEPLTAAVADLGRLKEQLVAAGGGEAGADELKGAVQHYLATHGSSIRAAAASVGEEARQQALEQLYQWRAQLAAQLKPRPGSADREEDRNGAPEGGSGGR